MRYSCRNEECEHDMEFHITPGRPAPFCLNPDQSAYHDPGDPPEVEGPDKCPKCSHPVDLDKVYEMWLTSE